ncbi:hypothetical protein H2O64_22795 [Kordia sp. YSTF-M3]|uniref:Bacteriocin n=1 Tax=Kordia aestuariivivens TaxID=2759037 RepID=A0ABR7QG14_9FLAO|nr:hypothetical protein [Kordia aestuariivivens]MBC8757516.1 hypothetical protein [Kordia aestuariivivens]
MLQKILKFDGVKVLEKSEQHALKGGKKQCGINGYCGPGNCCNTAGWCQRTGSHGSTGYLCDGGFV